MGIPMQKGRGLKGDTLNTNVCLRGNNLKTPLTYVTGSIHPSSFAFSNCPRMYEAYSRAVLDNLHGFIQSQKRQISNLIESDATKKIKEDKETGGRFKAAYYNDVVKYTISRI